MSLFYTRVAVGGEHCTSTNTHTNKQTNNDDLSDEKLAVQRITYTRISSLAFKVSSVRIDCYYYYYYYYY